MHSSCRTTAAATGGPLAWRARFLTTYLVWESWAEVDRYAFTHHLQLRLDQQPKNLASGYSFGTDPLLCDVLLGHRGTPGISALHFCITFNEQMRLVLQASSRHGTAVSYTGQGCDQPRCQFTWVLDLEKAKGKWEIKVHVPRENGLAFKIELASHEFCKDAFRQNVYKYIQNGRAATPLFKVLDINTNQNTVPPSRPLSPRSRSFFIVDKHLGSGSFGTVNLVHDVSTGHACARKQFNKRPELQLAKWSENVRREVRIMRENPHVSNHGLAPRQIQSDSLKENIVNVVDFWEYPEPFLFMPYFSLGNLADQYEKNSIGPEDTNSILFQALSALACLHPNGVAHRDMKPQNILVASLNPLTIKVADFGFANDKSDLKSGVGTALYMAPEIGNGGSYKPSVDIWSLGIIALQYTNGLPWSGSVRDEGLTSELSRWCNRIVYAVNHWSSQKPCGLTNLLANAMLKMKPEERSSASECLEKGYAMGIFDQPACGRTTPTQRTFVQSGTGLEDYNLGRATSTQLTVLQSGSGDVNSSCNLTLGALSATSKTARDENGRTGSSSREDPPASLWPSNSQLLGVAPCSRTASVGSYREHSSVNNLVAASSTADTEWQQSSGGFSARQHSNSGQCALRELDTQTMEVMDARIYALPDWRPGHNDGVRHYPSLPALVVAVPLDLLIAHDASGEVDLRGSALLGNLCDGLARLGIKAVMLQLFEPGTAIRAFSNSREIFLNTLTTSERMGSFDDLAWHLCCGLHPDNHMVRMSF